jgi:hypothetical protein
MGTGEHYVVDNVHCPGTVVTFYALVGIPGIHEIPNNPYIIISVIDSTTSISVGVCIIRINFNSNDSEVVAVGVFYSSIRVCGSLQHCTTAGGAIMF